jgi:hypothetical protein
MNVQQTIRDHQAQAKIERRQAADLNLHIAGLKGDAWGLRDKVNQHLHTAEFHESIANSMLTGAAQFQVGDYYETFYA